MVYGSRMISGVTGHKWNWLVLDIYFLRSLVTINISTLIQAPLLENVKPPGASNTENTVCCFTSHSRIFHSYGDLTICRWRASNFGLCLALTAIEQWGFFNMPTSNVTQVLLSHPKDRKSQPSPPRLEPKTLQLRIKHSTAEPRQLSTISKNMAEMARWKLVLNLFFHILKKHWKLPGILRYHWKGFEKVLCAKVSHVSYSVSEILQQCSEKI